MPSRVSLCRAVAAITVGAVAMSAAPSKGVAQTPDAGASVDLPTVLRSLDQKIDGLIDEGRLVRKDGYVYAIDLGLLMLAAALSEHRGRYERLHRMAVADFVVPRAQGLGASVVVWRRRLPARAAPDASGTTEALQLAHALMVGAEVFQRPRDAVLAEDLLEGYAKHATTLDGIWLVRNYYNLRTRTFATNSFLIDYGPDLLVQMAEQRNNRLLRETAEKSIALIRRARRPNGLIDMLVQPELKTLSDLVVFSPNDVIELEHAALVAELVAVTAPDVARGVLDFARVRMNDLRAVYDGSTGAPHGEERADAGTLAAIARLAVRLGDRTMIREVHTPLGQHAATLAAEPRRHDIHVIAQTLLGLHEIERWRKKAGVPLADTRGDESPTKPRR